MPPAPVTLAPVEQKELVEWEEFTGRVEPVETVELKPRVSGYITEVHFQAGALVKKGDVLFTIDQRPFETRLRATGAEVARAEANAMAMKREFDRVQTLLAAKAIAPEQAEARESMNLQAKAGLEAAKAAQHSAEIEFEHSSVKAPISRLVTRSSGSSSLGPGRIASASWPTVEARPSTPCTTSARRSRSSSRSKPFGGFPNSLVSAFSAALFMAPAIRPNLS